ncbi:MAG TPA: general secretion pathway protein GspD, partial [Planctomycetes bacterium]|nr:general secretion pathway protein GspD [Planctomycetota bacterium]
LSSMLDDVAASQQALARQLAAEIGHQSLNAKKLREVDPQGALELLQETRKTIEQAGLDPDLRQQLLRRVDSHIVETQRYIEQHQPRLALERRNREVRERVERERQVKVEVQQKLAELVDEYNQLMDEHRFAEAEVVAKQAREVAPNNPLAEQLVRNAKFVRRYYNNLAVQDAKENGFVVQLHNVDIASEGFDDYDPYQHNMSAQEWADLSRRRAEWLRLSGRQLTEQELEIQEKLRTPVMLQFENAPLSRVLEHLATVAAVNLFLDPRGLGEEGVTTDTPVTINLNQEISLKSALNLILEPLHLSYVIKDEVLKITSEQMREGQLYRRVYNVADLVVPIPNFQPDPESGLKGEYHDALRSIGFGARPGLTGIPGTLGVLASRDGSMGTAAINPAVLAQMSGNVPQLSPVSLATEERPAGLGGAALADFQSLINLIQTTVQPDTWDTVGGPGSIAPFPTNLSIVVSQTQEVHEEIVDLLEQLRRLQDLQVTIEVRFITLNDNFFERIGVDFDFDIDDNIDRPFMVFGRPVEDGDPATRTEPLRNTLDTDHDQSVTVGLALPGEPPIFTADLDIPFRQNSFSLAAPQFGGFDATAGAQLGFAILSDIEAFFFINAAQGDRRSNVLQAPKVTLFNGQLATVFDTSTSPFVISVVPVVGDFAAAQQPVIIMVNEGTSLTVQAVVSNDRRFVRLTLVPYFSRIEEVNTFQFEGSETTSESSDEEGVQDEPNDNTRRSSARTITRSGTSVQLPTVSSISVQTTVSVPDGGTVLLGGIKRLSEGRNEFGVPMLNKIPYINRLFKNVGIGRETQSLMMMVTPRIIIQEEEEEKLGIEVE